MFSRTERATLNMNFKTYTKEDAERRTGEGRVNANRNINIRTERNVASESDLTDTTMLCTAEF